VVVLGIPFNIYRYVPEAAAAAARVCTLVTFKSLPSKVPTFVTRAYKKAPRRFHTSWWRIVPLSVDAIVHCFSKYGVLSVWVGV
jgi:hypothetical protein